MAILPQCACAVCPPFLRPRECATKRSWKPRDGAIDMRFGQYLTAAALLALAGSTAALAAEPTGTWLTQTGTSRIRVADCGGALCGTIVWLKEPNDPDTGKPKTDKNNSDAA